MENRGKHSGNTIQSNSSWKNKASHAKNSSINSFEEESIGRHQKRTSQLDDSLSETYSSNLQFNQDVTNDPYSSHSNFAVNKQNDSYHSKKNVIQGYQQSSEQYRTQNLNQITPDNYSSAQSNSQFIPYTAQSTSGYNRDEYLKNKNQSASSKTKKKGKGPVFYLALVVLVLSLAALAFILFSYWQSSKDYDDTSKLAIIENQTLANMTVDWDALRAINPDICGWLYIPGTKVNYPVCHTDNNDYYLSHTFNQNQGAIVNAGCIFLEASNSPDFSDSNNVLYGHNMNDGSMFATIATFINQEDFDKNRNIYLLTPQGNYLLNTFAIVHVEATEEIVQTKFLTENDYQTYLQDKIDRNVVTVTDNVPVSQIKKSFMFSTCDNSLFTTDKRYILYAYIAETTVISDAALAINSNDSTVSTEDVNSVAVGSTEQTTTQ